MTGRERALPERMELEVRDKLRPQDYKGLHICARRRSWGRTMMCRTIGHVGTKDRACRNVSRACRRAPASTRRDAS